MSGNTPLSPVVDRVVDRFRSAFPGEPPSVFFAPGRVNLVGAHLDYSGGDVLPVTVDLGVYVAIRLREDDVLRISSIDQPEAIESRLADLGDSRRIEHHWGAYPFGVVKMLADRMPPRGFDAVYGGDLPMASGMSSSAAIEVATAFALDQLWGLGMEMRSVAMICHSAETRYVGIQCGIMDQFASSLGRAGHALLLHCADASYEHVEIHGRGFQILVMDTKKPRTLASVGFNQRVRECTEAREILQSNVRPLDHLADYTERDLELAGDALTGVHRKRARHVVTEMGRVARGVAALRAGDIDGLGAALSSSHHSAAEDYEVSCAELDAITAAACARPGVFGARLTGAGFGGCAIALIEPGSSADLCAPIAAAFFDQFGVMPEFRVLTAGGGPRRIG